MSELLTDEELARALSAVRGDVDWVATEAASGESRESDLSAIEAHIAALTDEIADRDNAIERITEDLNDAHLKTLRVYEEAQMVNAELAARVGELVGERDRARDWAVQLEQELNAAGGHAHANQQAIEGEV